MNESSSSRRPFSVLKRSRSFHSTFRERAVHHTPPAICVLLVPTIFIEMRHRPSWRPMLLVCLASVEQIQAMANHALRMPIRPPLGLASSGCRRASAPRLGFFDDAIRMAREQFREVTVQHILVANEKDALEIHQALLDDPRGVTPDVFGQVAAKRSSCGSAKKRPDAKLALLRGRPGELKFRRA